MTGLTVLATRLRLRAERRRLIGRGRRALRALDPVADRTGAIAPGAILCFVALRNERARLARFLDHYRALGVGHFLVVDNASTDGGADLLRDQPDLSLWRTEASYKAARFGMDWMNGLLRRHGQGHWCLVVDPDEFLVYPRMDTRPLPALTAWLDGIGRRSFPAMLLDLYPEGPVEEAVLAEGADPLAIARWFDPASYTIRRNDYFGNLWIQGGPRMRAFFADDPASAPALNKIPLVRWEARNAFVSSTHMLLPRGLNRVHDEGGERISGCLLHPKFLSDLAAKAAEEADRGQHYADGREYRAYRDGLGRGTRLWCRASRPYRDWRQLEELGLLSSGNWA